MKLGVNSVLFAKQDADTAFKWTKACGYDAIEISAIASMYPHLEIDKWREQAPILKELVQKYELPIQAMEQPNQDPEVMKAAFEAAADIGIPVVNCGPGGKSDDEEDFQTCVASLSALAEMAADYGVTLCVKAHVRAAIYNTPTSLRALETITSPAFGLDMDPSHVYRSGENPVEAVAAVVDRIRHVHIRDCVERENVGAPPLQANGRGAIDLLGYIRVLHEAGYDGPVDLEVIGAKEFDLTESVAIAAETRGHMQACLQACGAR
ncbi:MAG: sugar phosphate isomerase/epimerase [Lentisphaeria bacterium]|nr:sugar phosphate isomerase/epimerase [Lentisphaeria bacterium]